VNVLKIEDVSKETVESFFITNWGSPEMVISSGIYDCRSLDGFVTLNEESDINGLITYVVHGQECEIISLDSLEEGKGIGSSLILEVEAAAKKNGCSKVKLITTNDNLLALKFYQKRGYHLSNLYRGVVAVARRKKPEIPMVGNDGIPIRDEIELEKVL
jgi:GNAT superfamily N-acetyltransferase